MSLKVNEKNLIRYGSHGRLVMVFMVWRNHQKQQGKNSEKKFTYLSGGGAKRPASRHRCRSKDITGASQEVDHVDSMLAHRPQGCIAGPGRTEFFYSNPQ